MALSKEYVEMQKKKYEQAGLASSVMQLLTKVYIFKSTHVVILLDIFSYLISFEFLYSIFLI